MKYDLKLKLNNVIFGFWVTSFQKVDPIEIMQKQSEAVF